MKPKRKVFTALTGLLIVAMSFGPCIDQSNASGPLRRFLSGSNCYEDANGNIVCPTSSTYGQPVRRVAYGVPVRSTTYSGGYGCTGGVPLSTASYGGSTGGAMVESSAYQRWEAAINPLGAVDCPCGENCPCKQALVKCQAELEALKARTNASEPETNYKKAPLPTALGCKAPLPSLAWASRRAPLPSVAWSKMRAMPPLEAVAAK